MLNGGGRGYEGIRGIRNDRGLLELLEEEVVPTSDGIRKWIKRISERNGLEGLKEINKWIVRRQIRKDKKKRKENKGYILDIDATEIKSEKEGAKYTYKGSKGYMPMVGTIDKLGMVVYGEFREGNESPASRNLEFIEECTKVVPEIKIIRADRASYQGKIINWCNKTGRYFVIKARMDEAIRKTIRGIGEVSYIPYKDGEIAWTVHSMNNTEESFTIVIMRRKKKKEGEKQLSLFGKEEEVYYEVIATNLDVEELGPEYIYEFYNQRGEASENRIKELKNDFGMEKMPSGNFDSNAIYFELGIIAYNLFKSFQEEALPEEFKRHRVITIRWKLFNIAGKIVYHARTLFLKINVIYKELFNLIRRKTYEACFT